MWLALAYQVCSTNSKAPLPAESMSMRLAGHGLTFELSRSTILISRHANALMLSILYSTVCLLCHIRKQRPSIDHFMGSSEVSITYN